MERRRDPDGQHRGHQLRRLLAGSAGCSSGLALQPLAAKVGPGARVPPSLPVRGLAELIAMPLHHGHGPNPGAAPTSRAPACCSPQPGRPVSSEHAHDAPEPGCNKAGHPQDQGCYPTRNRNLCRNLTWGTDGHVARFDKAEVTGSSPVPPTANHLPAEGPSASWRGSASVAVRAQSAHPEGGWVSSPPGIARPGSHRRRSRYPVGATQNSLPSGSAITVQWMPGIS
jgi:hypothetical protein